MDAVHEPLGEQRGDQDRGQHNLHRQRTPPPAAERLRLGLVLGPASGLVLGNTSGLVLGLGSASGLGRGLARTRCQPAHECCVQLPGEARGEQAEDREDRQQPAPEVAPLQAHEGEEQQRGGDEQPAEAALDAPHAERAAERGERGDPAEAPGERPQVVGDAAVFGRAELALGFGGQRRLVHEFAVEARVVEQRVRVGDRECEQRADAGEEYPAQRVHPCSGAAVEVAREDRGDQRQDDDPGGVLAGTGESQSDAGEQVVADAPFSQYPGAAEQRERQRGERGHVVEREVRIEDGQEGDRLDCGGEQADGAVEQARAGRVEQP